MGAFTMAMFLGTAAMQWLTGLASSIATAHGDDPLTFVMASMAALLAACAVAFTLLTGLTRSLQVVQEDPVTPYHHSPDLKPYFSGGLKQWVYGQGGRLAVGASRPSRFNQ